MAKKNEVGFLIGPTGTGYGYGAVIDAHLSSSDLREAVIASAYLTDEAAEQLVGSMYGREGTKAKPQVHVVIGTKDQFTRRSAVRTLLEHTKGSAKAKCPVKLSLHCPRDPNFHVKAAYFRRASIHAVAIGSHNLTGAGLDSASELGVFLRGPVAHDVSKSLSAWVADSDPWAKVIGRYKERKLPAGNGTSGKKLAAKAANVSNVAADYEGSEGLTDKDEALISEAEKRFARIAPTLSAKAYRYLLLEKSRHDALEDDSYYRGSLFCYSDDYPGEPWRIGQERAVMRVLDVIPVAGGKSSVVACQRVRKFTVTAEIRTVAKKLKIIDEWPAPLALSRFLVFLKTGTLAG